MPRHRTAQKSALATVGECDISRYVEDDSESVGDHESVHSQISEADTRGKIIEDTLHSFKKSAFCLKTSYFMNKYEPPGGNIASETVWHTIVFKALAFRGQGGFPFLGPKLTDVTIWTKILSSILITIVIDRTWFS